MCIVRISIVQLANRRKVYCLKKVQFGSAYVAHVFSTLSNSLQILLAGFHFRIKLFSGNFRDCTGNMGKMRQEL